MIKALLAAALIAFVTIPPIAARAEATNVIETQGMIWRAPVSEGLTFDDVDTALNSLASGLNLRDVGRLPLGEQVALMQDAPWRTSQIYMFCNPLTAAKMIEHDPAFSVWLPCRISLVEDGAGRLWLYTVNMDVLMDQAAGMSPDLQTEAQQVRDAIHDLIAGAAIGEI